MPGQNGSSREGDGPLSDESARAPESRSSEGASALVSESDIVQDARREIGSKLDDALTPEMLDKLFEQVLALEKSAWGHCKSCEAQVQVRVADARAVVSALTELLNQAKGRPGTAEGEGRGSWVFENRVVLAGEEAL